MTNPIPKYTDVSGAIELISRFGGEYAVVENPGYVYPPYDIYPLAPRSEVLTEGLLGAVMDMDGTTTTTEPLCLHSLEMMVRRITGREHDTAWAGLDRERDYPHIIGNSTTKHVEYLIRTYQADIQASALQSFLVYAAAWTVGHAADPGRRREVASNLYALGVGDMMRDERFVQLTKTADLDSTCAREAIAQVTVHYAPRLPFNDVTSIVRAAVDIYYQRYHFILAHLAKGEGAEFAKAILGSADKHLIEPMHGIGVFLALIKGWLDDCADACYPILANYLVSIGESKAEIDALRPNLAKLAKYFKDRPLAVSIVTSSIHYEANIVLSEVFRVLVEEIKTWDVPAEKRLFLCEQFADYKNYYDGFITASDSSEIRLKPHRDLYSLALHQMGIAPADFNKVVGFEDSESGTIAIRAAGIPVCCALPFPETKGHAFNAATHVAYGGVPEVMLKHRVFLPESLLR